MRYKRLCLYYVESLAVGHRGPPALADLIAPILDEMTMKPQLHLLIFIKDDFK